MGKSGLWFTLIYLLLLVGISFEVSRTQSASDLLYEENLPFSNINHDLNTDVSHPQENNIEEEKLDAVLALLEKVQDQVNELQTNVDTMCKAENHLQKRPIVLKILEKAKCPQHAPLGGPNYETSNCGSGTSKQKNYFQVDGSSSDDSDEDMFCIVISPLKLPEDHYSVTAKLYNVVALYGTYYGFPGIAFNVQDKSNYDFVTIRIHDIGGCFRTGYVLNGKLFYIGSKSGICPSGNPRGRTWFSVEVKIKSKEAILFIDHIQAAIFEPHFPSSGKGGVIVKLGQRNVIRFKGLMVKPLFEDLFDIVDCRSHHRISANYYRLDSKNDRWPEGEFCKAISKRKVNSKDYFVSAQLFNQRGSHGTHLAGSLGLMYNAQDQYNYDFIFFKPESKYSCYFTGFVQNSEIKWTNSKVGPCEGGTFKGGYWNNVTLHVRDNKLIVYLDGKHILSTDFHFPSRAVAGVIVANDNEGNIISFMDFQLEPLSPNNFEIHDCNTKTRMSNSYYILDAKHGTWPVDTFCRAFMKKSLPGDNYVISAELFITEKRSDGNFKEYFGLAFNVKDMSKYDFVFVRPKNTFCYYVGYVRDGKIKYVTLLDGECKGGPPNKGTWFKLDVYVRDGIAMIEFDGKHLVSTKPHYEAHSKGGIIVANGFKNMLTFRNFKASLTKPLPMQLSRCGPKTHVANDEVVLDAAYPYWPVNLFCAALYKQVLDRERETYTVQAMLHNINSYMGSYWGQLGLMYNAHDHYTYEYVYLRIHNKANCYQFGTVRSGIIAEKRKDTNSCLAMRPKPNEWFRMEVKVRNSGEVHLLIGDVTIAKHKASLQWNPRGGILSPNGYKNVIMARNYTIY